MNLAGQGIVAIWHDIVLEAQPEFYEWHNRETCPRGWAFQDFAEAGATSLSAETHSFSPCMKVTTLTPSQDQSTSKD